MKRDESLPDTFFKMIQNEVEILKSISHKNIIWFVEYFEKQVEVKSNGDKKNVFCIVLEFAQKGELFHYLSSCGAFPESITRYYFHQLIDAVEYLHNEGISHWDLKPDNMLLDENYNLKLADFGFSSTKSMN